MNTISLCMIVKDEEEVLARCLESVQEIADEIIIVDTGSSDRTIEIAHRYTQNVFFFPWQDDFSAARNFSFSKAHMDYCMWLDADDIIEQEDRERLLHLKHEMAPDTDVVMMLYHTAFDGQGKPVFSYYRERLLRREKNFCWQGAVHESIAPSGKIIYSDAAVCHHKEKAGDPGRNLHIYETLLAQGQTLSPRDRFYYARELYYHRRFEEASRVLTQFLDSGEGWKENCLEACRILSWCRKACGDVEGAFFALLRGLRYGAPRAELCCELGGWFFEREEYRAAIFWYEAAVHQKPDLQAGGFVQMDACGYVPYLQMNVCWYRLGEIEKACACNEAAETFRPGDETCQSNRIFYRNLGVNTGKKEK